MDSIIGFEWKSETFRLDRSDEEIDDKRLKMNAENRDKLIV